MTLIILLFSIGIILIAAEVIVPGGILGSIGAILFFAGCVLTFLEYGNWVGLSHKQVYNERGFRLLRPLPRGANPLLPHMP